MIRLKKCKGFSSANSCANEYARIDEYGTQKNRSCTRNAFTLYYAYPSFPQSLDIPYGLLAKKTPSGVNRFANINLIKILFVKEHI